MDAAKRTSWKTTPLPDLRTTIPLEQAYSAREMAAVRRSLVPEQMEDKWFVYWEDGALYFHRSWTGVGVYAVRFETDGDGGRIVAADLNRDPKQYAQADDTADAKMILYLIEVLLLQRYAEFPSAEPSQDKRTLQNWGAVGRAMLGEHPGGE